MPKETPKVKRPYHRRNVGIIGNETPIRNENEPWNQPEQLLREAADHIKRIQHRLEIADAKLEMVYLFSTILRRDDRSQCGTMASQESIVSRIERKLAPVPERIAKSKCL